LSLATFLPSLELKPLHIPLSSRKHIFTLYFATTLPEARSSRSIAAFPAGVFSQLNTEFNSMGSTYPLSSILAKNMANSG
jgi:hypothetical protein